MDKTVFLGRDINDRKHVIRGTKCNIDNDVYVITDDEDGKEYTVIPDTFKIHDSYERRLGEPKPSITQKEEIEELQELLVQTCIDFINKKGLKDIWGVYFQADDLNTSAEYGEWTPSTDSYIRVEGIEDEEHNGVKFGSRFLIGERY